MYNIGPNALQHFRELSQKTMFIALHFGKRYKPSQILYLPCFRERRTWNTIQGVVC